MASEGVYSRFVAWLKILLPLAALVILSSVVYFARDTEEIRQIPFVAVEGEEFERERVTAPEYTSLTGDGAAIRITASEVSPAPGEAGVFLAETVKGRLETAGGRIVEATAPTGRIDGRGNVAELIGTVRFDTSDGYRLRTEGLSARLDISYFLGGGPVLGVAPMGHIEAGQLAYGDPELGGDVLRFTGSVKLIYEPRN